MLQPLLSITEMLWECSSGQPGRNFFFFLVSPKILGLVFLSMFAKQNSESYLSTVFVLKLKTFAHYMLNFYYFPGVGGNYWQQVLTCYSWPAWEAGHGADKVRLCLFRKCIWISVSNICRHMRFCSEVNTWHKTHFNFQLKIYIRKITLSWAFC